MLQARKDAVPMKAKLMTPIDAVEGFKVDHGKYSANQGPLQVERHFIPPCTLRCALSHTLSPLCCAKPALSGTTLCMMDRRIPRSLQRQ